MFREIEPEIVDLTPEFAKRVSNMPRFRGDRDRDSAKGKRHIADLSADLQCGAFYTPVWSIVKYDSQWWRIDGGHSSKMLTDANCGFPTGKKAFLRKFVAESAQDLAELFSRFDRNLSVRTALENLKAHASTHDDLDPVKISNLGRAVDGIACALTCCGEGAERMTEDERVRLTHHYRDFILFAQKFVCNRYLQRSPVAAVIFLTFEKDEAAAGVFWTHVRDEDHPDRMHPSRRLASFLREACIGKEKVAGSANSKLAWSRRAFYVKCIHAWNAFRGGHLTDLKYYENSPIPEIR